jgi:hypothetical protein
MVFCEIAINTRHLVSVTSLHGKRNVKPEGNLNLITLTTFNFQTTDWILILKFTLSHKI